MATTLSLMLIRHGIAAERSAALRDADRPLTEKGRQRTTAVARWLYTRGERWQYLASSPLVRARQTAELFLEANLASELEILPVLAPGGEFGEFVRQWQLWTSQGGELGDKDDGRSPAIAIVGHQPDLSEWIELAVWGQSSGSLQLKKAGVARVVFPGGRVRLGAGILAELLTPKSMLNEADG